VSNPLFTHWSHRGAAIWFLLSTFFMGSALVFIGALVVSWLAGSTVETVFDVAKDLQNPAARPLLLILTGLNQVGSFIVAVWAFTRWFGRTRADNLSLRKPSALMMVAGVAMTIAFLPLLEWTLQVNELMAPEGSALGEALEEAESHSKELYEVILRMEGLGDALLVILLAALLPSVGEELAFRGVLQNLLVRSTRNVHAGIWIAAALFSFYHMQFFGFIPRLLLGALFGYMMVWSGSVWVAMAAHFTNNLLTVVLYYLIYNKKIISEEAVEQTGNSVVLVIGSVALVVGIFWLMRRNAVNSENPEALPAEPDYDSESSNDIND